MMDRDALAVILKEAIEADPGLVSVSPDQRYWDEENGALHTGVEGLINCTSLADDVFVALGLKP